MKISSKRKKHEKNKNNEKKKNIWNKSKKIIKKKTNKYLNEKLLNKGENASLEVNKSLIKKKKNEQVLSKGKFEIVVNDKNDRVKKKKKYSNALKNDELLVKKKIKIIHTSNTLKENDSKANNEIKVKEENKKDNGKKCGKIKKKENNVKSCRDSIKHKIFNPSVQVISQSKIKKKNLKKEEKNEISKNEKKKHEGNSNSNEKNAHNEYQKKNKKDKKISDDKLKNICDNSKNENKNLKKRYMNKNKEESIKKKCISKEKKGNKNKEEIIVVKNEKEKNVNPFEDKKNAKVSEKNTIFNGKKKLKDKTIIEKVKSGKNNKKNDHMYEESTSNPINFIGDNENVCKNEDIPNDDHKDIYSNENENIKMTFDVTNRFTVLGCDWDNISSVDVFYLFESYYNFEKKKKKKFDYSKSRAVKKVTIYTSKYGEKKLKYEEEHGPLINFDLLKKKKKNEEAIYRKNNVLDYITDKDENENENKKSKKNNFNDKNLNKTKLKKYTSDITDIYNVEDEEKENEQIRLYQIQRSRYYFALVECYNKEIVEFLYEELNDMDADFCINYLDLRIINDNCSLNDYKIKEFCDRIPENYKFFYCFNSALKHTYAKSTWDENPKRKKILSTKFSEENLRELDLKEYLASSSGDEESDYNNDFYANNNSNSFNKPEKCSKENYRKLLLGNILNEEDLTNEKSSDPNEILDDDNYNEKFSTDEENSWKEKEKEKKDDNSENFYYYNNSKEAEYCDKKHEKQQDKSALLLMDKNGKIMDTNNAKNKSKIGKGDFKSEDSDKENEVTQIFKNILTVKEKNQDVKNPWEKYLDKVKMKKKMKKKTYLESLKKKDEEIKKIIAKKSNKRIKNKKIKTEEGHDTEKIHETYAIDNRFSDLYKNKDFNLDVTSSNFKKTKFNEQILQKKL